MKKLLELLRAIPTVNEVKCPNLAFAAVVISATAWTTSLERQIYAIIEEVLNKVAEGKCYRPTTDNLAMNPLVVDLSFDLGALRYLRMRMHIRRRNLDTTPRIKLRWRRLIIVPRGPATPRGDDTATKAVFDALEAVTGARRVGPDVRFL